MAHDHSAAFPLRTELVLGSLTDAIVQMEVERDALVLVVLDQTLISCMRLFLAIVVAKV